MGDGIDMDNRVGRVIDYFNSLDWGNMTAGEDLIRNMERLVATTGEREKTLEMFRLLKNQLEELQKIQPGEVQEENIRTMEEIMAEVDRFHNKNVSTPYEVAPSDVPEEEVEQGDTTTGTTPVNVHTGNEVPVESGGLVGFDLNFDEVNEDEDSIANSHVVINRRGSGEPVVGDVQFEENTAENTERQYSTGDMGDNAPQEGNVPDNDEFMADLLGSIIGQTREIVLGKDVEDADKEHIHTNAMMMSYFSLQPYEDNLTPRRNPNGQIPMDYAVSVMVTHEVKDGELEGLEDEVMITGTVEQAIEMLTGQGYEYNKSKNIFSKANEYGLRSYARITFDIDLRAVLG